MDNCLSLAINDKSNVEIATFLEKLFPIIKSAFPNTDITLHEDNKVLTINGEPDELDMISLFLSESGIEQNPPLSDAEELQHGNWLHSKN